ncbi:MAG TPA: CapA family protein [Anaerolineales bacterium]|nr:CapA family protein [Anaerolineales bacterium]
MLKHFLTFFLLIIALSACQPAAAQLESEFAASPPPAESEVQTPDKAMHFQAASTQAFQPALVTPLQHSPTPTQTRELTPSPTIITIPKTATPAQNPVTRLLFTGVIVPARCVQAHLDEIGNPDYPYEEVQHILEDADISVGSFNATMSDQVEHTGCVWTYQLVGSPENADALARTGFDLMSAATNHIKDCGLMRSWCDETFFETLGHFQRVGIQTVGAGANLSEALEPVVITVNGIRFGFVSLGDSKLSETVFATDDNPGIARLTEENMRQALDKARQISDVVIALPHWGPEDELLPNWIQRGQARYIVNAGADLVVGNHTHVIQAYQTIDEIPVFYGLGNFVFDQGLRDHRQGVILIVSFEGTRYLGYEMIPTHVDPDGRVHLADPEESAEILERLQAASGQLR